MSLKLVASRQKITMSDSAVSVSISLTPTAEGLDLGAKIHAQIDGVDRATAQQLLEAAHEVCPYSRATRGNISQEISLIDSE